MRIKHEIKQIELQIERLVKGLTKNYDEQKVNELHALRIKLTQLNKPKRRTQDVYLPDIKIYGTIQEDF